MPLFEYAGKHPEIPPDGKGVVRPLDVWQAAEMPGWGAWRELTAGEAEALTADEPDEPGWRRDPYAEPAAAAPQAGGDTGQKPDSTRGE